MKICLTGAHGTGKSTLLEALQSKLPGYTFQLKSLTRSSVNGSNKLNFGTTEETQKLVMAGWKEKIKNAPDNYFASRSYIDVLAYTIYFSKINNISQDFVIEQFQFVKENLKDFGLTFYLPIEFEQKQGGEYREGQLEHPNYQKDIDKIIKFLLYLFDVPYLTITGTVEERVNQVLERIKE